MARSTLARHRMTRLSYGRTSPEGGGGGGNPGGGGQPGTGGGNPGGGGGDPGSNPPGGSNPGGDPANGPNGFPLNTRLDEMKPEQREAYWKHYARQHEQRADSRSDYDEQKRLADLYRDQQRQQMTPDQRAIDEAKEAGRREATAAVNNEQVANLLRVSLEARGKSGDELTTLVAAANPAAFITDGKVDAAKVSTYAATLAGSPGSGGGGQPGGGGGGGIGQGRRGDGAGPSKSVGAGRDLYADRHKNRQPAGSTT